MNLCARLVSRCFPHSLYYAYFIRWAGHLTPANLRGRHLFCSLSFIAFSLSRLASADGQLTRCFLFCARQFRDHYEDMKYMPLDLRPKKTRAIRRRLTPEQVLDK